MAAVINTPVQPPFTVPWYRTLFFRVVVLCAVLLLCLFAALMAVTRHFLQEASAEMEARSAEIAHSLELRFEEGFEGDYHTLETDLMDLNKGVDIKIENDPDSKLGAAFTMEHLPDGRFVRVARVPLMNDGRRMMMTATVTILPQTEILRAFQNKYMLAVLAVFVVALGMMVWVIWKALHPLRRLSESCAAISGGHLEKVGTRGASGEILALETTFNRMVDALREKEAVEARLRQAQRLSALGTLAAGVAHDVRNPLNAIKLLSSHAIDLVDGGADAPAVKPLQTIRAEVARLEEIVSGFLSLARESEIHPEPANVDTLLQDCVRLFQREAEQRGVRLTGEYRTGGAPLRLDPKQINRAVLNVLLNALEACPAGGRVRLFSRLTDRACEIEIRDDGPGLPREVLDRVFDPYYTTKPGGTGLGLSVTRGIIEEHGGTIELTSTPEHGCQVLVSLPLDKLRTG
jgi:signal transduction histidine kinase